MTTCAYSPLYLAKTSRAVGNMLHDAVLEFDINGTEFLRFFTQSDVAGQIENGNPKYIAGKSGLELFIEVTDDRMKHKKNVNHVLQFILYNKFFRYMSTNSYNNIKKF